MRGALEMVFNGGDPFVEEEIEGPVLNEGGANSGKSSWESG